MSLVADTALATTRERVIVAMSGGVDSSVVAALVREQGYDAVGVSMRLYRTAANGPGKGCCSPDDLYDARAVAASLQMPFYVVNYEEEFERRVIARFVEEYRRGRTPSPCVLCNNHVKFDTLLERALALGARFLATGHYARVERVVSHDGATERFRLLRGVDRVKDQSYFLFGIARQALDRLLFPLGGLDKDRVRALAERFGLVTARKPESQDLCFVGGGRYLDFIESRLPQPERRPGVFVDQRTGEPLGRHDGVHQFTVGQRRGLGIGGGEPLYVVDICADTGRVTVGPREALGTVACTIEGCNWLAFDALVAPIRADVQIRYRQRPVVATVEPLDRGRARIRFSRPEPAVAPGQAAVLYDGEEVLGGGWIADRS